MINVSNGQVTNTATINANQGNVILGANNLINQGSINTNNQKIALCVDECSINPLDNGGSINAGANGFVITPVVDGTINGQIVAKVGFDVMGLTMDDLDPAGHLKITSLTDTEYAIDGGTPIPYSASGEISSDGTTITIMTGKSVEINIGDAQSDDIELTKNLRIVSPNYVLVRQEIIAEQFNVEIYAGNIDVNSIELVNGNGGGFINLLSAGLIVGNEIESDGNTDELGGGVTIMALDRISWVTDDNNGDDVDIAGIGTYLTMVACKDMQLIPQDESDFIDINGENTSVSLLAFDRLVLLDVDIEGNVSEIKGTKLYLLGRRGLSYIDTEDSPNLDQNSYKLAVSTGPIIFNLDDYDADSSSTSFLSGGDITMQFDGDFEENNSGDVFVHAWGCFKYQAIDGGFDANNGGIITAIAKEFIQITVDDEIDVSNGETGGNGGRILLKGCDEIALSDYDVSGDNADGSLQIEAAIRLQASNSMQQRAFPIKIIDRSLSNFMITSGPGSYAIESSTGLINIPSTAQDGDVLMVSYEDDESESYLSKIIIKVPPCDGPFNFPEVSESAVIVGTSGTITNLFNEDGTDVNVSDQSFGMSTKHVGESQAGDTEQAFSFAGTAYTNGLTLSRQYDGTAVVEYSGNLTINTPIDLSSLGTGACLVINVHEGSLFINENLTAQANAVGKGGTIIINVTNGVINNNADITSVGGSIILGAPQIINSGNITTNGKPIMLAADPCKNDALVNSGQINAGNSGVVLTPRVVGSINGNIVAQTGFEVNGLTDADIDPNQVLTITALSDTDFEIDGGGSNPIPASGEVSTDGTTITIATGKTVVLDVGSDLDLDRNLKIISPNRVILLDEIDVNQNKLEVFAGYADVNVLEGENDGGAIYVFSADEIKFQRLVIAGPEDQPGGKINLWGLGTVFSAFSDDVSSEEIESEGEAATINLVSGKSLMVSPKDESNAIELDGNNTQLALVAFDRLVLLDADLEGEDNSTRIGTKWLLLGRNRIDFLDAEDDTELEDNSVFVGLSTGDINIGSDGIDGVESSMLLLSNGNIAMQFDDDIELDRGSEFFARSAGDFQSQTIDSHFELERGGNITIVAGGQVTMNSDDEVDVANSNGAGGRIIIKANDRITLSELNLDGLDDQDGTVQLDGSIKISCLPGPHIIPFPVDITDVEFLDFELLDAPPGYIINPATGAIFVPPTATENDLLVISYVDDDGMEYQSTLMTPLAMLEEEIIPEDLPTMNSWMLIFIFAMIAGLGGFLMARLD